MDEDLDLLESVGSGNKNLLGSSDKEFIKGDKEGELQEGSIGSSTEDVEESEGEGRHSKGNSVFFASSSFNKLLTDGKIHFSGEGGCNKNSIAMI